MSFSPGSNTLFYKYFASQDTRKMKVLTSKLKLTDPEALLNKFLFIFIFSAFFFSEASQWFQTVGVRNRSRCGSL